MKACTIPLYRDCDRPSAMILFLTLSAGSAAAQNAEADCLGVSLCFDIGGLVMDSHHSMPSLQL